MESNDNQRKTRDNFFGLDRRNTNTERSSSTLFFLSLFLHFNREGALRSIVTFLYRMDRKLRFSFMNFIRATFSSSLTSNVNETFKRMLESGENALTTRIKSERFSRRFVVRHSPSPRNEFSFSAIYSIYLIGTSASEKINERKLFASFAEKDRKNNSFFEYVHAKDFYKIHYVYILVYTYTHWGVYTI
jgi:hypothetical protein